MRTAERPDVSPMRRSSCACSGTSDKGMYHESGEVPFRLTLLFLGSFGAVPCTWKKPRELFTFLMFYFYSPNEGIATSLSN